MIQLNYRGKQYSKNLTEQITRETYIGTENDIDSFISSKSIGVYQVGKGKLFNIQKNQQEGQFFTARLEYTKSEDEQGDNGFDQTTGEYGKTSQVLSVRNMSLPIESHPNYRTKWNHYLIAKNGYQTTVPQFYFSAKNTVTNDENYKWVQDLSNIPDGWSIVREGKNTAQPWKPGVESFDFACFVITESRKFNSAQNAGKSIEKKINTIVESPKYGDMGLTENGYDWKIDDCNIAYNGKYWIATTTYTRSGNNRGWDKDLYSGQTNDNGWSMEDFVQ